MQTLNGIAKAYGVSCPAGAAQIQIPAPGHSRDDRSISLRLVGNRVLVHGFADVSWKEAKDELRRLGFIDGRGNLAGSGDGGAVERRASAFNSREDRVQVARNIWLRGTSVAGTLSQTYATHRGINRALPGPAAVRHHERLAVSIYNTPPQGRRWPAMITAYTGDDGRVTAVEATYLDRRGHRASRSQVRIPRKTIGVIPPGTPMRLDPLAEEMVVGEGTFTALSAGRRFALPCWAFGSAKNLSAWIAPDRIRRLIVAADRDAHGQGEAAARMLVDRMKDSGRKAYLELPPARFADWNEVALGGAYRPEGDNTSTTRPKRLPELSHV